jgi:hypothetical protein
MKQYTTAEPAETFRISLETGSLPESFADRLFILILKEDKEELAVKI